MRGVGLMSSRRWWAHALLMLALLLTQQGALRHALAHAVSDAEGDHHAVLHAEQCKLCLAFAADGGASPAPELRWLPEATAHGAPEGRAPVAHVAGVVLGYRSRAPPAV